MKGTVKAIYDYLSESSTLTNKLANNKPYNDESGETSRVNSIVPSDMVTRAMDTPFLSIDEGNQLRVGVELESETLFIRCYNSAEKSYYEINEILDTIKLLLDNHEFTISDRVHVQTIWEATLAGIPEEDLGMKSKTSRYRILVL